MIKFLIGPALMGTGYLAGSYYGSDVEQVVHKSPDVTYAASRSRARPCPA